MIRAAREVNLQTKAFGGAMIGLQFAGIKAQLGPLLNGVIGYDIYLPAQAGNSQASAVFSIAMQVARPD